MLRAPTRTGILSGPSSATSSQPTAVRVANNSVKARAPVLPSAVVARNYSSNKASNKPLRRHYSQQKLPDQAGDHVDFHHHHHHPAHTAQHQQGIQRPSFGRGWLADLGFDNFSNEMSRLMNDPLVREHFGDTFGSPTKWKPSCDIERHDDKYVLNMELPGIPKDQVKIEITDNNQLVIQGERKFEKTDNHTRVERFHGEFRRQFSIPRDGDISSLKASLKDGILHVNIPRAKNVGKEIQIE